MTDDSLTITTRQGRIEGALEPGGVRVWRGVPYAAAPVGASRFTAPAPHPAWNGVRAAKAFSPISIQPALAGVPPREGIDEDCLYLNVWSPRQAQDLPVLVWIHGGGYFVGSGSTPVNNGSALAENGPSVVVTLNYRLGARGFLDLSMLNGAAGRFETNLGLRDQIAALNWVRDNIREFGGDPDRVTIFGQSAGGGSVCCLVASPLARGLFGAAIAESPPANSVFDRERAAEVTGRFLAQADLPAATFNDVLAADPADLVGASGRVLDEITDVYPGHHAFQPVIDAEVLLDTPIRSIAVGHGSSVPLMIGSNEDEGSLFAGPPMPRLIPTSQVDIDRFLEQDHPDVAARVRSAYVNHGRWGNGVALGGDGMVTAPVTAIAEAMSAHAPSYVYRFRWSNADLEGKRLGAPHTIDVPFVWGTLDQFALTALVSPGDDSAVALSRTIQNAWLSFAKKRTPLVDEVGWAPYSPRAREVLVFDRACSLERDPGGRQREAWGSFAS